MNLVKIDSEQLSFSFWAGYVLFDTYEISYSSTENELSAKDVFNFLKQKGFGKNLNGIHEIIDEEKIYGIYNLTEIHFDDFMIYSKDEFLNKLSSTD